MDILLVEDDSVDEEALRRLLPRTTNLECAKTLCDAIALLEDHSFELVLLDLGLPDSSGITTLRRLREVIPNLPIVVTSGLDDEEVAVEAIRHGAQDYIVKDHLTSYTLRNLEFAIQRVKLATQLQQERANRERLEVALRQRERELAHMGRVAVTGEVVAELAHEVGQPLQVISNYVDVMQAIMIGQQQIDCEAIDSSIDQIGLAAGHAQGVFKQLRGFVRDSNLESERIDLNDVIRTTTDFVDFELKNQKIAVNHDLASGPVYVDADVVQIQQVLINLIRNAIAAMEHIHVDERQLSISSRSDSEIATVEVHDTGCGLNIEAASAFQPFTTTKTDGLGMGLAICARIVRSYNGNIRVSSAEQGTSFEFDLPLSREV